MIDIRKIHYRKTNNVKMYIKYVFTNVKKKIPNYESVGYIFFNTLKSVF